MNEVKKMVELKKEAVKDVASLTKNSASSIGKTKEVLTKLLLIIRGPRGFAPKYTGTCVVVDFLYGIQKWMSIWKLLMVNWMKSVSV